ncbi:MAG: hypothetical protein U0821_22750 [Chloroflexota bacterium]
MDGRTPPSEVAPTPDPFWPRHGTVWLWLLVFWLATAVVVLTHGGRADWLTSAGRAPDASVGVTPPADGR